MKSLENKTGLIFDLFFCIIFMPLLLILGPAHSWWREWPLFTAIVGIYLYGCYFAAVRLKLPQLILAGRYRRIGLIAAGFLLATYLLTLYPLPKMDFVTPSMSEYQTRVRNYNVAVSIWFMFSMVLCYSLTVEFIRELYKRTMLQSIAENQRNKARLAVFKAQISPHFLFNTLNSLYSLVIGTSPKAEDAFIKFTEILKYTYVTIDNEFVRLDEEIRYIENYIDLQLIRLDSHTRVNFRSDTDNPGATIPPMILLTFVENAFKYGASTSRDCEISILISLAGDRLRFETHNSIIRHTDEFRTEVPTGIENCRGRLEVLYPGRHTLLTEESDGAFHLTLTIDLNNP